MHRLRGHPQQTHLHDEERGAFFLSHVETINETEVAGDEEFRFCSYPNATVIRRLTAHRAKNVVIIGSILEALAGRH